MKIAVLGVGHTKFGELWEKGMLDLLAEVQLQAIRDAELEPQDVEEIVIGNMCGGRLAGQQHLGAVAATMLRRDIPATRVEAACASGGVALRTGILSILAGTAGIVLVSGVEKMTDVDLAQVTNSLMGASIQEVEQIMGATFPSIAGIIARSYMQRYSISREMLAYVSVKNHFNAMYNDNAHLHKIISINNVLEAPMVADPLSLYECSPISDGAASIVLASPEVARRHGKKPLAWIVASSLAVDDINLANRNDIIDLGAVRKAAQRAYAMAGITPQAIDVAELHDAFSFMELMTAEEVGFFEKGKAVFATMEGKTALQGELPINTSGGLKAKGHPIGATGVAQAVEVALQLSGRVKSRQIANRCNYGLIQNMGGAGTTAVIHILKKEV